MASLIIEGNTALTGEITVSGNKNAVLPAMAASLLTDDLVTLENVPRIRDVKTMGLLLSDMGVTVDGTNTHSVHLSAKKVAAKKPDDKLVADLRASVLLLGPLLARFGSVTVRHPGGDIIGRRSIDEHLKALTKMGARVHRSGIVNSLTVSSGLKGAQIYLSDASVTATENTMMAASLADGDTEIVNAASEPHVVCLGTMLTHMGANISGIGTRTIRIRGVSRLHGCTHAIRPDYTEFGTWAIAAATTGGNIRIHGVHKDDVLPITSILTAMGVVFEHHECKQHRADPDLRCVGVHRGQLTSYPHLVTNIWPGFPTDLMSPAIVLSTQCQGTTLAHDWMYEGRMFFVDRLIKMGAQIIIADPHRVIINGPTQLFGRHSASPDIRAGVALVIAALSAKGNSVINMVELIDRGYEDFDKRLFLLGARLKRTS